MKKTYLTPETIETTIELQKMIATSVPNLKNSGTEEDEADQNLEVLSRRRNQWEDEEEEEEDF